MLGKHSGRHALKQRCEQLGYTLKKEELDHVYTAFTTLADRKKGVLDEEIIALIEVATATTVSPIPAAATAPTEPRALASGPELVTNVTT